MGRYKIIDDNGIYFTTHAIVEVATAGYRGHNNLRIGWHVASGRIACSRLTKKSSRCKKRTADFDA